MLLVLVPLALTWSRWAPAGTGPPRAAPRLSVAAGPVANELDHQGLAASMWTAVNELDVATPSVLLSIESSGTAADVDGETPVVLPGYLLPDDNHEEAAHEGG